MNATVSPSARTCVAAAFFIALLAAAAAVLSQAGADKAPRDRSTLLALLKSGEYERLDFYFFKLQDGYEQGDHSEARLENSYAAFASADPDLQAKLEAWIERVPQSFAARLARGEYYRHLGRISLRIGPQETDVTDTGTSTGTSTRTSTRSSAYEFLSLARRDVEAAIQRHPRLGIGYGALIGIAMAENAGSEADRWFSVGLEADPGSVSLRRAYLLSLRPWLRPDQDPVELMAKLRTLAQDYGDARQEDPDLAALQGFPAYATAELLRRQRRHSQADRYYREALAQGRDWLYLRGAGINALQSAKAVAAVGFFSEALALRPQNPALLDWRAHALWSLGNHETALADWQLALSLDPGNSSVLFGYAQALRDLDRAELAAEMLDHAVPFAEDDPQIRSLRGQVLLADLNRPSDAIDDLRMAVELDPHAGASWRAYAEALYRANDCDGAASAIITYQRLCANGTRCAEDDLAWAKKTLRSTRDPDNCPVYGILGP